jgi:hypothetical protein
LYYFSNLKLPKVPNTSPIGENSANLVTLVVNFGFRVNASGNSGKRSSHPNFPQSEMQQSGGVDVLKILFDNYFPHMHILYNASNSIVLV